MRSAFTFSLVGVIIQVAAALVVVIAGLSSFGTFGTNGMMGGIMGRYYESGMMGFSPWGISGWGGLTWLWVPFITFSLAIGVVGVLLISSLDFNKVRSGSILVLVAALLAFPTAFGFIVGSLLMVVGGVLGLTSSPATSRPNASR